MSHDKESDRSRRKKRRGQLDHEKKTRRAEQLRAIHAESKMNDAKLKLDVRTGKLVDEGYSMESIAKRMGLSLRRINAALDANRRQERKAQADHISADVGHRANFYMY